MRRLPIACIVLCAAAATAEEKLSDEDRAFIELVNAPVRLKPPGMDKVKVQKDLVYQGGPRQKADVFSPPRAGKPSPMVIFIHGGVGPEFTFRPKDWGIYQSYGRAMAASGFTASLHLA